MQRSDLTIGQNHPYSHRDEEASWPGGRADRIPKRRRWPRRAACTRTPSRWPTRSSCPATSSTPGTRSRSSTRWCARSRPAAPRSPRPLRRSATPARRTTPQPRRWNPPGWKGWCGPARPAHRTQAHRPDPRVGRGTAGRRPRPAPGAAGRPDRGGLRRARAPPLGGAGAGPPPGAALQKPLTCRPARKERRSTRPCPCDLHLAMRLLNRATARMPARSPPPAAGSMPATSNCVMPPCTHAPGHSRSGSACWPARASPPGSVPWPAWASRSQHRLPARQPSRARRAGSRHR